MAALTQALRDPYPEVRAAATQALANLFTGAEAVVAAAGPGALAALYPDPDEVAPPMGDLAGGGMVMGLGDGGLGNGGMGLMPTDNNGMPTVGVASGGEAGAGGGMAGAGVMGGVAGGGDGAAPKAGAPGGGAGSGARDLLAPQPQLHQGEW